MFLGIVIYISIIAVVGLCLFLVLQKVRKSSGFAVVATAMIAILGVFRQYVPNKEAKQKSSQVRRPTKDEGERGK